MAAQTAYTSSQLVELEKVNLQAEGVWERGPLRFVYRTAYIISLRYLSRERAQRFQLFGTLIYMAWYVERTHNCNEDNLRTL